MTLGRSPACGPAGLFDAVLACRRVPVRPGAGEIGRVAAADGVDVDAVDAVRQARGGDAEGHAARRLPHPHAADASGRPRRPARIGAPARRLAGDAGGQREAA